MYACYNNRVINDLHCFLCLYILIHKSIVRCSLITLMLFVYSDWNLLDFLQQFFCLASSQVSELRFSTNIEHMATVIKYVLGASSRTRCRSFALSMISDSTFWKDLGCVPVKHLIFQTAGSNGKTYALLQLSKLQLTACPVVICKIH